MVKKLPAMQEALVPFLGREDPLEEKLTAHSSVLPQTGAWKVIVPGVAKKSDET